MFKNITEVKQANKALGHYFFSADTMSFFASKVESELSRNQLFITSEKKCFEDYTRVYSVRRANSDGSISTLVQDLASLESAQDYITDFANRSEVIPQ